MPLACVPRQIRCEPPGLLSGPLRDRGYVGPMGAYDEAAHPWLAAAFAATRDPMVRSASDLFHAWLDQANSMS
jgi:hypothetical protein